MLPAKAWSVLSDINWSIKDVELSHRNKYNIFKKLEVLARDDTLREWQSALSKSDWNSDSSGKTWCFIKDTVGRNKNISHSQVLFSIIWYWS